MHSFRSCSTALFFLRLFRRLSFGLFTIISWDRYRALRYPLRYPHSSSRIRWNISLLLIPFLVYGTLYSWGLGGEFELATWNDEVGMCELTTLTNVLKGRILVIVSHIYPVPLLGLIVYFYVHIFLQHRASIKHPVHRELLRRTLVGLQIHSHVTKSHYLSPKYIPSISSRTTPGRSKSYPGYVATRNNRNDLINLMERGKQFKIAVSLLAVITFNCVSWLPQCIHQLLLILNMVTEARPLTTGVLCCFLYSAVCLNALIYSARCRDIKDAMRSCVLSSCLTPYIC